MTRKFKEVVIPIEWQGWEEINSLCGVYYAVEFLDNFGVFVKGEKFECVDIDYNKGLLTAYDSSGEKVVKIQLFKCNPI